MLFLSTALVITSLVASVQAAGVLHTNVDCSQHKNATDTRICSFRFGIDTKADAKQPFKKECSGSKLMDLVDNCPVSSTVFQGNATLYEVKRQFSPECWVKQCTVSQSSTSVLTNRPWMSTSPAYVLRFGSRQATAIIRPLQSFSLATVMREVTSSMVT